jgi:hypothetical protein
MNTSKYRNAWAAFENLKHVFGKSRHWMVVFIGYDNIHEHNLHFGLKVVAGVSISAVCECSREIDDNRTNEEK